MNVGGRLVDLSSPKVMAILNTTPDSFYSGSRHEQVDDALKNVEKLISEGADFIDIGGYSTRPGADHVSIADEVQRTSTVIQAVMKHFPEVMISIDTFRTEVASAALDSGALIVNDVSGGQLDDRMFELVGNRKVPYILTHMRGTPQTMANQTIYEDLLKDVVTYFAHKLEQLRSLGALDVIIDPGFGFAKNLDQNYFLLKELEYFKSLEAPVLIGLSRKSMLYKLLDITADAALNATTAAHMIALQNGANILRVHDVRPAVEAIKIFNYTKHVVV